MNNFRAKHFLTLCSLIVLLNPFILPNTAYGASDALINGQPIYNGIVGDTLFFTFVFSPNDSIAQIEVWIDLDKDLLIDKDFDHELFNSDRERMKFIDGGFEDDDEVKNGAFLAIIDDFYPLAPAHFIFRVTDSGGSTEAYLIQIQMQSPFIIEGTILEPDSVANLLVGAVEFFDDSLKPPKSKLPRIHTLSSAGNFLDEDREILTLTDSTGAYTLFLPPDVPRTWMVFTFDMLNIIHGYAPPEPLPLFVDGYVGGIDFAYLPANSYVGGMVTDENGALLQDEHGNPLEATVVLSPMNFGFEIKTETVQGFYAFDVFPGDYEISVVTGLPRYMLPPPIKVWVSDGDSVKNADFMLYHTDSRIGGMVMENDHPFSNAMVFARNEITGYSIAFSMHDGLFELPVSATQEFYHLELNRESIPPRMEVEGGNYRRARPGATDVLFRLVQRRVEPIIIKIRDIPMDQGKQVRVMWHGSGFDKKEHDYNGPMIAQYGLWRGIPMHRPINPDQAEVMRVKSPQELAQQLEEARKGTRFLTDGDRPMLWDFIATIPAIQNEIYAYVSPTLGDSTIRGIYWSYFYVTAHTDWSHEHYASPVDSGYSIDNLRPPAPILTLQSGDNAIELAWNASPHADVVRYYIYRSQTAGFVPDENRNRIAITGDNFFEDANLTDGINYYYRVEAVDDAWNTTISDEANIFFTGVAADYEEAIPTVYELSQNYPNPFNPITEIAYQLPQAGYMSITIYNLMGEKVITLVEKHARPGTYRILWNGQDFRGRNIASGIYLYQMQSGSFSDMKRMILLR